jgi:dipeptidase
MCDTMAIVGPKGVLFGKNSDREFDEPQLLELHPRATHEPGSMVRLTHVAIEQAAQTHKVLLSRPCWIWGAEIGANEHGLVIGNEAIFSWLSASTKPGIIGMDFVRLALERAADVEEAIGVITGLLAEHGQSGQCGFRRDLGYHNSFLLADRSGAAVLETLDRDWVMRRIGRMAAISNMMSIGDRFDRSSPALFDRSAAAGRSTTSFSDAYEDRDRTVSGRFRQARASGLLQSIADRPSVEGISTILRDHVQGPSANGKPGGRICAHAEGTALGQSTASWVADLTGRRPLHWVTASSSPCVSVFKPVLLEAGLPGHGPPPSSEEDDTSFWWRHDKFRRAMMNAPGEIVRPFEAERDLLEASFRQRVAPFAETDGLDTRGAAAAIGQCWAEAMAFEEHWSARLHGRGASAQGTP